MYKIFVCLTSNSQFLKIRHISKVIAEMEKAFSVRTEKSVFLAKSESSYIVSQQKILPQDMHAQFSGIFFACCALAMWQWDKVHILLDRRRLDLVFLI